MKDDTTNSTKLGSQPLFDDEYNGASEHTKYSQPINKKNTDLKGCDHHNTNHWLFQKSKNYQPIQHPRENITKSTKSIDDLNMQFNLLVDQLRSMQKTQPPGEWLKPITPDFSVFADGEMEYLFRGDKMKLHRKINMKFFPDSDHVRAVPDNSLQSSSFASIQGTSRYPIRRAKEKALAASFCDSEGDADEDFDKKPLKRLHIEGRKKQRQIIYTNAHHFHPSKKLTDANKHMEDSNICDEEDVDCIVSADDDDSQNQVQQKKRKRTSDINTQDKGDNVLSKLKTSIVDSMNNFFGKKGSRTSLIVERSHIDLTDNPVELSPPQTKSGAKETIKCPICDGFFPTDQIEQHASDCFGSTTTRTRRQRSQANYQDNIEGQSFDNSEWEKACSGLNDASCRKPHGKSIKDEVLTKKAFGRNVFAQDENCSKSDPVNRSHKKPINCTDSNERPNRMSFNNYLAKQKQKDDAKKFHEKNNQKKLTVKNPAASNFLTDDDDDDGDLFDQYRKNGAYKSKPNKTRNLATNTRTFNQDENQENRKTKCSHCDELVNDSMLKAHTDNCFPNGSQNSFFDS